MFYLAEHAHLANLVCLVVVDNALCEHLVNFQINLVQSPLVLLDHLLFYVRRHLLILPLVHPSQDNLLLLKFKLLLLNSALVILLNGPEPLRVALEQELCLLDRLLDLIPLEVLKLKLVLDLIRRIKRKLLSLNIEQYVYEVDEHFYLK